MRDQPVGLEHDLDAAHCLAGTAMRNRQSVKDANEKRPDKFFADARLPRRENGRHSKITSEQATRTAICRRPDRNMRHLQYDASLRTAGSYQSGTLRHMTKSRPTFNYTPLKALYGSTTNPISCCHPRGRRTTPGVEFGPCNRCGKTHGIGPHNTPDDSFTGNAAHGDDVCCHCSFLENLAFHLFRVSEVDPKVRTDLMAV